jgi:O-antigen/teichoic acid export membrane protein
MSTSNQLTVDVSSAPSSSGTEGGWATPRRLWGGATGRSVLAFVDQGFVSGTRFLTTLIVGRFCGAHELGVYSLGFALLMLIASIQESLVLIPYTVYGSRLHGNRRRGYAGNLLAMHAGLAAAAALGLLAFSWLGARTNTMRELAPTIAVLTGIIPLALLRDFARRMSFAHLRTGVATLLDIGVSVLQIGGLVWLARIGWLDAATAYGVVGVACGFAGLGWLAAHRRDFRFRWVNLIADLKRTWNFGKWVFASGLVAVLNGYSLYWLLSLIIDTRAAGVLAACHSIVFFSNPLILGLGSYLAPRASLAFGEGGVRELRMLIGRATVFITIALIAFCVMLWFAAASLLNLLYGPEFAGHGMIVVALATGVLASGAGTTANLGLFAMERPDIDFKSGIVGLAIMVSTMACLAGPWGLMGVALALIAGNTAATTLKWISFVSATRMPETSEARP